MMSVSQSARLAGTGLLFLLLLAMALVGCSRKPRTPLEQAQADLKQGRWNIAIDRCAQILAEEPNEIEAISIRARALGATGQYDQALVDLTRWVELAPDDPEPLYHRAIAYDKLGESELADGDRKNAKAIDPLHKRAYAYELPSTTPARVRPMPRVRDEEAVDPAAGSPKSAFSESLAGDDSADEETGFDTLPSHRRAATRQADKDAARKKEIGKRVLSQDFVESGSSSSSPNTSDVDVNSLVGIGRDEEPARSLDNIAEQLFEPGENDDPPRTAPEPVVPPTPRISTALPTDPYGNIYTPGQLPLGANPNTGYANSIYPPYSVPPGFGPANFSSPVSAALPPQLQGKLGTNAGVNQYGGTMYPGGINTGATGWHQPPAGYGSPSTSGPNYRGSGATSLQLPSANPLAPPPTYGPGAGGYAPNYNPNQPLRPQPVSSALPAELMQQIQQNRSTAPLVP